jgi:hypothetical protein
MTGELASLLTLLLNLAALCLFDGDGRADDTVLASLLL